MAEPVVGREKGLEAAAEFLEDLERRPAALIFEGEPGIGKTTLWRAAAVLAEARGFRVLASRPAEADKSLSFAGLADLLGGIELELFARLPRPQRTGLDAALLRGGGEGSAPDPRAVFAGGLSILKALASETPVLVAVTTCSASILRPRARSSSPPGGSVTIGSGCSSHLAFRTMAAASTTSCPRSATARRNGSASAPSRSPRPINCSGSGSTARSHARPCSGFSRPRAAIPS
jgi:hypothetical protein